ncbi:MAG: type II toxin-antitoxin system HipA family toxin [Bacteroidota bacterium]
MINNAFINIWDRRVGAIAWDADSNSATFEYAPSFISQNLELAPVKMPMHQGRTLFSFPELANTSTFKGLPGLLADILPDRYGNALINTWLAQQGRPADSMNPVEMLCFIGTRGMGALEFEPVQPKGSNAATKIELENLVNITAQILSNRENFETDLSKDEQKALMDILKVGTSAGGARAKAVIAYNETTGEVRSGQADAPDGFTYWLIKFDGIKDSQFGESWGYGRVEMAYHLMALDCGIEMTECRILEENDRAHFMTKRFDRTENHDKLHVQTWCAMSHLDYQDVNSFSYELLFQTMRGLRLPYPQAEQLYRRMVFNVLARNCDDHTKNFAFVMDRVGQWRLSPAYDVCHAYRPGSAWVSRHALSINGKRENINRFDFLAVAKQMNIKKADHIIDSINEVVKNWLTYTAKENVDAKLADAIKKTLIQL